MTPKTVLSLHIGMSVRPHTVAPLLHHCPCLVNFTLYRGGNCLSQFRVIVDALNSLTHLRYLSVDPAWLFRTNFVYLPDTSAFHSVTHLDLTTHWALDMIAIGFKHLPHLTHLSITWKMSRMATHDLLALLQRKNFRLILLWLDEIDGQARVIEKLHNRKLNNPQVVLLRRASNWPAELSGGFWLHAERIIAWRKENGSELRYACSECD